MALGPPGHTIIPCHSVGSCPATKDVVPLQEVCLVLSCRLRDGVDFQEESFFAIALGALVILVTTWNCHFNITVLVFQLNLFVVATRLKVALPLLLFARLL